MSSEQSFLTQPCTTSRQKKKIFKSCCKLWNGSYNQHSSQIFKYSTTTFVQPKMISQIIRSFLEIPSQLVSGKNALSMMTVDHYCFCVAVSVLLKSPRCFLVLISGTQSRISFSSFSNSNLARLLLPPTTSDVPSCKAHTYIINTNILRKKNLEVAIFRQ